MIPNNRILKFMGIALVRLEDVNEVLNYSDRLLEAAINELKDYRQDQMGPFQWQRRCAIIVKAEEYLNNVKNEKERDHNS